MSTDNEYHVVSGCFCYMGQGYSPCDCPARLEMTAAEHVALKAGKLSDEARARLVQRARRAQAREEEEEDRVGHLVTWYGMALSAPVPRAGACYQLLGVLQRTVETLDMDFWDNHSGRFHVAYLLNDEPRVGLRDALEPLLDQFDTWEGVCRSYVRALVVHDTAEQRLYAVDQGDFSGCDAAAREAFGHWAEQCAAPHRPLWACRRRLLERVADAVAEDEAGPNRKRPRLARKTSSSTGKM